RVMLFQKVGENIYEDGMMLREQVEAFPGISIVKIVPGIAFPESGEGVFDSGTVTPRPCPFQPRKQNEALQPRRALGVAIIIYLTAQMGECRFRRAADQQFQFFFTHAHHFPRFGEPSASWKATQQIASGRDRATNRSPTG